MITHVLFVDSDAEALARIKQALEQAGDYEAKVFVTGDAALEYAAQNPPDVAVIAFNLQDMSPEALSTRLRQIRPDLPIVLRAPLETDEDVLQALQPDGILHGNYTTRLLLPLMEEVLQPVPSESAPGGEEDDSELDTRAVPSVDAPAVRQILATTGPDDDVSAFGEVLESIEPGIQATTDDSFKALVDSLSTPEEKPSLPERHSRSLAGLAAPDAGTSEESAAESGDDALFQKLAAEEPPFPTLEDTGTVHDLITITDPDFTENADSEIVDIPEDMIPGFDEAPLSAAEQDLLDALAAIDSAFASESESQQTDQPDQADLIPMPDEIKEQIENGAVPEVSARSGTLPSDNPAEESPAETDVTNTAALAVQLTQHTLDSSAKATVLLHNNTVIASAGDLPESDIETLAQSIDTSQIVAAGSTKIKFASLPDSRVNYMVIATPTVEEMVLMMIFTDEVSLRSIRRQAQALAAALTAPEPEPEEPPQAPEPPVEPPAAEGVSSLYETPAPDPSEELFPLAATEPDETHHGVTGAIETDAETAEPITDQAERHEDEDRGARETVESAPTVDPATLTTYACAWVLRDPDSGFDDELCESLPGWVQEIISARHWMAEQVDVQPDYISAVIGVPPGESPSAVVHALMQETAQRIMAVRPDIAPQPGELWADAYYIVTPGRPLSGEEISNFISFQREN